MAALNLKPPQMAMLALLAIGSYYLLTRKATAGGVSSGVAAANSRFFVSPSAAGATLAQQAATAAQNQSLFSGALGFLQKTLSPSVTSAIPSAMRQSEKASYDLQDPYSGATTGDFARSDRSTAVSDDAVAANGPALTDPYTYVEGINY